MAMPTPCPTTPRAATTALGGNGNDTLYGDAGTVTRLFLRAATTGSTAARETMSSSAMSASDPNIAPVIAEGGDDQLYGGAETISSTAMGATSLSTKAATTGSMAARETISSSAIRSIATREVALAATTCLTAARETTPSTAIPRLNSSTAASAATTSSMAAPETTSSSATRASPGLALAATTGWTVARETTLFTAISKLTWTPSAGPTS